MIPPSLPQTSTVVQLLKGLLTAFVFLISPAFSVKAEGNPEGKLAELFEATDLRKFAESNKDLQIYRLTVVRSFDAPLQFELVRGKFEHALTVKKAQRETIGPEYRYTKLVRDSRLALQDQETESFVSILTAAQFWRMPAEDFRRQGLDGSTWTLEGIRDGKYHKVVRDNPFLSVEVFEKIEKLGGPEAYPALSTKDAYGEGLLAAAFAYLWALSGEANEELY